MNSLPTIPVKRWISGIRAVLLGLSLLVACTTIVEQDDPDVDPEEKPDSLSAQGLKWENRPGEMFLADGGRRLVTGGARLAGLYDSALIRTVNLTFSQTNYWSLLQSNYASKTELPATLTVDGIVFPNVGVRFKGAGSYEDVIKTSQKVPFKISLQYVETNPKLMGYKTLNFNNFYEDPSFLREVFYNNRIRYHVPAARACFIRLSINGEDWGIYAHLQQQNKDFLEEWFFSDDGANWSGEAAGSSGKPASGWGTGKSALNYLGEALSLYQSNYSLKSSDISDPWPRLAEACRVLNQTGPDSMTAVMPRYFDVDRILWFLACENAFADEDSYIRKGESDYYIYYEPETGRMTTLESDGNSTLKSKQVSWSPFYNETNVNYPLLNRLLAVPRYRQRYLAHLRTIIANQLNPLTSYQVIDNYKNQIDALVKADPKKLVTYQQFISGVASLKTIINSRRNFLLSHAEVGRAIPDLSDVVWRNSAGVPWGEPAANTAVTVNARVSSATGIREVNLWYSPALAGRFHTLTMSDDGQHGDGAAGDGIYGGTLPAQTAGTRVRFYVEAVAADGAATVCFEPEGAEHDVFIYLVK